jgi:hypothetical protein
VLGTSFQLFLEERKVHRFELLNTAAHPLSRPIETPNTEHLTLPPPSLRQPKIGSISEGRPLGVLERLQKRGSGDSGPLLVSYETLREVHDDLLKVEAMMSNHVETLYMQKPEQARFAHPGA